MRTNAENELCKIHSENMNVFYRLQNSINKALKKAQSITVISEKEQQGEVIDVRDKNYDEEELAQNTIARDFLHTLHKSHHEYVLEFEHVMRCMEPQNWLNDKAINYYMERILQPISDKSGQGVLFIPTEYFELLKQESRAIDVAKKFQNRYNMEYIEKYVLICNLSGQHWFTVIIEYNTEMVGPSITLLDSMSIKSANETTTHYINKVIEMFSLLFDVDPGRWNPKTPLNRILQNDGVNCGIWALLFAESTLADFLSIPELSKVVIENERKRIAEKLKSLLEYDTYHKSFTYEGPMYKFPNPESARFLPERTQLQKGFIISCCDIGFLIYFVSITVSYYSYLALRDAGHQEVSDTGMCDFTKTKIVLKI